MHDVISAYMLSQEIDRTAREKRYDRLDPDTLYRYEIWDSIGAAPSLRERFGSLATWFRRRKAVPNTSQETVTDACAPSATCAPQT